MKKEVLEALLNVFMKTMEVGGSGSEQTIGALLGEMYESAVSEYRPLIRALPGVVGKASDDLVPVVLIFLNAANSIRENQELQEALKRQDRVRAKLRMQAMKEHMEAGFTRAEAMAMILQDIASAKSSISGISDSIKEAAGGKNKK